MNPKAHQFPVKFRGSPITISSYEPLIYPEYFAYWYLERLNDNKICPHILVDKPVELAFKADKLSRAQLDSTLEHEYDESNLAFKLALNDGKSIDYILNFYTGRQPIKHFELDEYGGEAHEILANGHPGGRIKYEEMIQIEFEIVYLTKR